MTVPIATRIDLASASRSELAAVIVRSAIPDESIRRDAADIVSAVREGGDAALDAYSTRFGGGPKSGDIIATRDEMRQAHADASRDFVDAIEKAVATIRAVHEPQIPRGLTTEPVRGVTIERTWSPLRRVGVYVPGGAAAYPSSLLMSVVPAQVAGVPEIAVACPASDSGAIDTSVLCAAHVLGVSEVYTMGGAQAIGALAYGTETIPRVDKIVGPGGAWVTAAKLAVYGTVGIDLPAGPSEAAIVIDSTTDPVVAASDLLCQAEHGPDSVVMLVGTDRRLLDDVLDEASAQLEDLERRSTITEALARNGIVVFAESHPAALRFVNDWAPEHVSLLTVDPASDARSIPSAGSVLLGQWTPESAGDYATGANHVLPTGGLARAYGPLSTEDFGSWRQIQELSQAGLMELAPTIRTIASREGLTAHAACVDVRIDRMVSERSHP